MYPSRRAPLFVIGVLGAATAAGLVWVSEATLGVSNQHSLTGRLAKIRSVSSSAEPLEGAKVFIAAAVERLELVGERLEDEVTSWGQVIRRREFDPDYSVLFAEELRFVELTVPAGAVDVASPVREVLVQLPDGAFVLFELTSLRFNWHTTTRVSGETVRDYSAWLRAEADGSLLLLALWGGEGPGDPWTVAGGSTWGEGTRFEIAPGGGGGMIHDPYDSGEPDNDVTGPGPGQQPQPSDSQPGPVTATMPNTR